MKRYKLLFGFAVVGLLMLISSAASAHKVNVFAYVEGDTVYCEGYFPDGRVVDSGKIEVYDSQDNKLLEGITDKEGKFSFKAPKPQDLKIVIIASMGHKNSYLLTADEFSGEDAAAPAETTTQQEVAQTPAKARVRPPKQEPFPMAAVLGGLGFIFGLTALIMQLRGRKKG